MTTCRSRRVGRGMPRARNSTSAQVRPLVGSSRRIRRRVGQVSGQLGAAAARRPTSSGVAWRAEVADADVDEPVEALARGLGSSRRRQRITPRPRRPASRHLADSFRRACTPGPRPGNRLPSHSSHPVATPAIIAKFGVDDAGRVAVGAVASYLALTSAASRRGPSDALADRSSAPYTSPGLLPFATP